MSQEIATFAGGCFWCIEAIFNQLRGVSTAISGYCGGECAQANYKAVCTGTTGHAEVVQVSFDNEVISYQSLLNVFFNIHDPSQLNRQGADVGTQYRSAIFYHDQAQLTAAQQTIARLSQQSCEPIHTTLEPMQHFYPAEHYHQDYFANNTEQGYCSLTIAPKIEKFQTQFKALIKN